LIGAALINYAAVAKYVYEKGQGRTIRKEESSYMENGAPWLLIPKKGIKSGTADNTTGMF
jgi:hypothetical protein